MEGKLFQAACSGDLNVLHDSVREDAAILQKLQSCERADTPLHLASMYGYADFVREYVNLSSISIQQLCKLNHDGYNPLHLASTNGHVEIVKSLLEFGKQNSSVEELCMKKDRDGRTALHCAVFAGKIDIIDALHDECPNAATELTFHQESVLHLAVRHHQFEALKFLIQKLGSVAADLQNLGDREGNTLLHLATARRQLQIVEYLVEQPGLDVNAENSYGLRALEMMFACALNPNDLYVEEAIRLAGGCRSSNGHGTQTIPHPSPTQAIPHPSPSRSRSRSQLEEDRENETQDWLKEMQSGIIVMASLIATISFQIILTPPGGVWQDSHTANDATSSGTERVGKSVLYYLHRKDYNFLMFVNTQAFFSSISIIILMLKPITTVSAEWIKGAVALTVILTVMEFLTILTIITRKKFVETPAYIMSIAVWWLIIAAYFERAFRDLLGTWNQEQCLGIP